MKNIPLNHGLFAIVDDEDYDYLMAFKWYAYFRHGNTYARTAIWGNGKTKVIWMHRLIIGAIMPSHVDHKDHNGLNNQKNNLRLCTPQQNRFNSKPNGYKGVKLVKSTNRFESRIKFDGRLIQLGTFGKAKDAAMAYNKKAIELFGEFACLNIITP
jgi:hypothetical protein